MPWTNLAVVQIEGRSFQLLSPTPPSNAQPLRITFPELGEEEFIGVEVALYRNELGGVQVPTRWFQCGLESVVLPALPALPTAPGGQARIFIRVFNTNRLPVVIAERWVP